MEASDGQNTDPQSTDYPNGWTTLKWTTPKNTISDEYDIKSCDFILTLHEPAYFCSAWPSAAILIWIIILNKQPLDTKSDKENLENFENLSEINP